MVLGGLQKLTLIDYPGKLAATVFTVGCNFSCPFCHNPELVDAKKIKEQPRVPEKEFFDFLDSRREKLEAVCITGGEPTIQPDLEKFIRKIKDLGFLVKLDTNGTNPDLLEKFLAEKLVDYVAMDIKTALENYGKVVGRDVSLANIQRSVELTRQAPDYEFRTTILPALHSDEDILSIGRWLQGSKKYYLQQFRPIKTLDAAFEKESPMEWERLVNLKKSLEVFFGECGIRE
ncbi:MAG: anaerobic ribonucleoside-triphosphate reductase activating protein [Candidatus Portnoybacteria bacterium]|jgi:pyruvate formate lyase activating enzyme|nr:anaerobic ribonucleoside-triphosphate reductase activating protein [Candidatus Portnoybacteria bacterium]